MVKPELCAWCGQPAKGFATIDDKRYCHDDPGTTCYMQAENARTFGHAQSPNDR